MYMYAYLSTAMAKLRQIVHYPQLLALLFAQRVRLRCPRGRFSRRQRDKLEVRENGSHHRGDECW